MACDAVFRYWRVLPKERTAPFPVTLETVLVDCALGQQLRIRAPVRIMAIRARDFSFSERHVR